MLRRIMANDTWSQYQSKSLKNYTLESTDALLETMSPAAGMAAGGPAVPAAPAGAQSVEEVEKEAADPGEGQLAMGLRLKKEYKVRTERELTDCATCHR